MAANGPRSSSTAHSYSVRSQLLLLVLAVSVPLMVIVGLGIYSEMQQTIAQSKSSLRVVAAALVSNTGGKLANARHLLEQVAIRPLVRQVDPKRCDEGLKDVLSMFPGYANIGYSNLEGVVICSAVPQPDGKLANIGKTAWYQQFRRTRGFSVGQPFIGPITNRLVSVFSVPIWNEQKEMVGAVHLPLDLENFDPDIPAHLLPAESRYGFVNQDQVLIWRNVDPQGLIGTRIAFAAARQLVETREGEFEADDSEGTKRFYSVTSMPEAGWIAYVGVPTSIIYAAAKQRAAIAAATATVVVFILILLVVALARRIVGPISNLESIARAVHDGDSSVRAAIAGPREIAEVAQKFNAMLDAQQRSEARFRRITESDIIGFIFWNINGEIREANAAFLSIVGYSQEDLKAGRVDWRNMTPPEYQALDESALAQVAASGSCQAYEKQYLRKDGSRVPILFGGASFPNSPGEGVAFVLDISARKQAEAAQQESEKNYRVLVEWSPEPMGVHRNGIVIYANPAARNMFGATSPEEVIGKSIVDLIHPDSHAELMARFKSREAGTLETPLSELTFFRLDGEIIDVEVTGTAIVFEGLPAVHISMRDVTGRNRAAASLAAAQARIGVLAQLGRQLAEASTPKAAAVHILDAAQALLKWDAGLLRLWDPAKEKIEVVAFFDLIDGEIRDLTEESGTAVEPGPLTRRVVEGGALLILREAESDASLASDGPAYGNNRRALSLLFVPIKLGEQLIGVLTIQSYRRSAYTQADLDVLLDLASHCAGALLRLQGMDALRESEERFRSLVKLSSDWYWEKDAEFRFTSMAGGMTQKGNLSLSNVLGKASWELPIDDISESEWAAHRAVLEAHESFTDFEYRILTDDGSWHYYSARGEPVFDDHGRFTGYRGTANDITERKRAEAARASLEAQLRESQKMQAIGTLAGGIAHDFNNIIAAILGNAELAREDAGNNPVALQSLDEIRKSASRARDLVQQILSFSRRQPTDRRAISLVAPVEEAVRLLRATLPGRVALDVQLAPALPSALADATQIQQVVLNLVTNAVQALQGEAGRIAIRLDEVKLDAKLAATDPALRAMHARHQGSTLRLIVEDSGVGMDAATRSRIFEPFFTTKPVDEGTGLGLAVVHGIVQGHEGAICVRSELGKGSTFTLYLAAAVAESAVAEPAESAVAALPSKAGIGQHILYIDDDESLVFLVKRLLERRGYSLSGYTDAQQGLAALKADPLGFDLVVTDYNMPDISGLDVARAVRELRADLPVAVASGFIDEALRAQAEGAGVRELIFKANAVEDLCEAFARLAQTVGSGTKDS